MVLGSLTQVPAVRFSPVVGSNCSCSSSQYPSPITNAPSAWPMSISGLMLQIQIDWVSVDSCLIAGYFQLYTSWWNVLTVNLKVIPTSLHSRRTCLIAGCFQLYTSWWNVLTVNLKRYPPLSTVVQHVYFRYLVLAGEDIQLHLRTGDSVHVVVVHRRVSLIGTVNRRHESNTMNVVINQQLWDTL